MLSGGGVRNENHENQRSEDHEEARATMNQWARVVWTHRQVTLQSFDVGDRALERTELWVHKTYLYQLRSKGEK